MMKDTKTEKNKLRRYLDDMYIREEASQLLESMRDADHKDILDELSAEVWRNPSASSLLLTWSVRSIKRRLASC